MESWRCASHAVLLVSHRSSCFSGASRAGSFCDGDRQKTSKARHVPPHFESKETACGHAGRLFACVLQGQHKNVFVQARQSPRNVIPAIVEPESIPILALPGSRLKLVPAGSKPGDCRDDVRFEYGHVIVWR